MRRNLGRDCAASLALAAMGVVGGCVVPGETKVVEAASAPGASAGGRLTVAITAPGPIDPVYAEGHPASLLASLVCETLVVVDPATGVVRPALAESWVVSDGGRGLHFKLRRNQVFHDGTRVDSKAVVDSLRRLANPQTASDAADLLSPVIGYEAFRGDGGEGVSGVNALAGIRVIEPYSFEISLSRPKADFVRTFAHPATAPVNVGAASSAPAAFAGKPICAGPYEQDAPHSAGAPEVRLRRFLRHHATTTTLTRGGSGWADEIALRIFPDPEAAYQAWQRGEVDVSHVPEARMGEAAARHGRSLLAGPGGQVTYIGLPRGDTSPFADRRLRQGLAAALDRREIAEKVFDGSRLPATGYVPPTVKAGYRPDACRFEPPSGHLAVPPVLKLAFNDEFRNRALAEAVAAQWKARLGVQVELEPMSWEAYLQKATLGAGFEGAFRVSWTPKTAAAPSAVDYLEPLFHSRLSAANFIRYNNALVDEALDKEVAAAVDDRERALHVQNLEEELCRDIPAIPLLFSREAYLVRQERVGLAREDGIATVADGGFLLRELFVRT